MRNNIYIQNVPSLVAFATVVNTGSFTRAAEELYCSKAAVSRHINVLEERIGFKILHRTTRRVSLTPHGQELFACCQHIIDSMDEANRLIDGIVKEPRGQLRIAAPLAFTLLDAKELLVQFLAEHPGVLIDLEVTDRLVDLDRDGVEVAFILGEIHDTAYDFIQVDKFSMMICGSPRYLEQHGTPDSLQDLSRHECIVEQLAGILVPWRISKGRTLNLTSQTLRSNSGRMSREAALADLGLAYLPSYLVAKDIAAGRLRPVLEDIVDVQLPLYAIYRKEHRSVRVQAFIKFLKGKE